MPMSLNSLLQTHPYKRKDCLEFICAKIKVPSNGYTADTLRQKILEHTDDDKEMEEQIRASRKSCEGQDKGKRGRNSFVSLATVEHLVHGEGLQEVGADGVMPDFLLAVVATGGGRGL